MITTTTLFCPQGDILVRGTDGFFKELDISSIDFGMIRAVMSDEGVGEEQLNDLAKGSVFRVVKKWVEEPHHPKDQTLLDDTSLVIIYVKNHGGDDAPADHVVHSSSSGSHPIPVHLSGEPGQ